MLRFGAKGFLGSASPVETFRLDQAIVGVFLSPVALGLYATGLAFTNLPRLVALALGSVAYPSVAGRSDALAGRRAMWRFFALTLAASSLLVLALEAAAGWLVTFFFGTAFVAAVPITRILLIGAPFLAARRVLTDASRGAGLVAVGSVIEVASWGVLVPLLAVGASLGGVTGVAVALVISSVVSLALMVGAVVLAGRRGAPGPPLPAPNATQPTGEPGPA